MAPKKNFKLPKWIRDTLQAVVMIAVLMAVYNFFGPMIFPNGSFFPWWTFPYSVLAALLVVGAWNLAARKFRMISRQLKDEEAAKRRHEEELQEQLRRQGAAQERTEAQKRRSRNQSKQQSR